MACVRYGEHMHHYAAPDAIAACKQGNAQLYTDAFAKQLL